MRALVVSLATAAVLLAARPASAYERQWHAGASFGYLGGWNGPGHGFGGGLDIGYGVRDWLDVVGAVDVSYHPANKLVIPTVAAGVRFTFDFVQVVPHVGLLVGFGDMAPVGGLGGNLARLDLAVPFGVDYQVSRSFTIGVAGRFQVLLANGTPSPMLGAFARATYVWGY
jgi:hypothetical protein